MWVRFFIFHRVVKWGILGLRSKTLLTAIQKDYSMYKLRYKSKRKMSFYRFKTWYGVVYIDETSFKLSGILSLLKFEMVSSYPSKSMAEKHWKANAYSRDLCGSDISLTIFLTNTTL